MEQRMVDTGSGGVPYVKRAMVDPTSKVANVITAIFDALDLIVSRINKLQLGTGVSGTRAGNLDAQYLSFTTPPGATVVLAHGLGRVPIGWDFVYKSGHCDLRAGTSPAWSNTQLTLVASAASVFCTIRVY